jgi:hypothetical protein
MDEMELIRTAHAIDQHLGILVEAVKDETLRGRIHTVREEWCGLAYAITAEVCGVNSGPPLAVVSAKRRGRRKSGTQGDADLHSPQEAGQGKTELTSDQGVAAHGGRP